MSMSEELLQPPSQPYIGCIGSSPDFIHHPHQSFGQSSMDHGSSSSLSFYHPAMPFQTLQTTIHHSQFHQTHQDEDDDESHQQQPPIGPSCGSRGHK
ncbi:hypothetical protein DEO72_LG9g3586 [Vigna unguiculata]|uniref:Uncharacterized protein n=1 Tax=Vigna unguiculata TaxID=3917 RepID=A0A4D6N9C4_VIGUN|nr:hypothetical protein DEO72_LG9g3586 [Vigna unguiculata]